MLISSANGKQKPFLEGIGLDIFHIFNTKTPDNYVIGFWKTQITLLLSSAIDALRKLKTRSNFFLNIYYVYICLWENICGK